MNKEIYDNAHKIEKAAYLIHELNQIQNKYFESLISNMNLNEKEIDFLFDYMFNRGEDEADLTFVDYLKKYKQYINIPSFII